MTDLAHRILERTDGGREYLLKYAEAAGYEFPSTPRYGKEYRSKGGGKICIKRRGDRWSLIDFSGGLPGGDVFRVAASEHGLTTKGKDFPALLEKLARELNIPTDNAQRTPYKPTRAKRASKPEPEAWIPNKGYKSRVSSTYKIRNTNAVRDEVFARWCIDQDTLDRYGVCELESVTSKRGYTRYATEGAPLFLFECGGNKNVYSTRPVFGMAGKKRKTNYLESTGNYVFGYDQLPKKCKAIIFAAGQKDTLALNALLNDQRIYAIALNSEGATLPEELYKAVSARCEAVESVYVLYDNDKTGYLNTRKLCERYPDMQPLHVPDFAINDVCDFIEQEGAARLEQSIKAQMEQPIRPGKELEYVRKAEKDLRRWLAAEYPEKYRDYFAYEVPVQVHKIKGFIGENEKACKALEKFIFERKKTQLVAPTGSGKTTFIFRQLRALMATVEAPFIFAVPTQALADQVAQEYALPCVREGADRYDLQACEHVNAMVCTYDSIHKVAHLVPCATIFFDESHHLVNDASKGYKFRQVNRAMELAEQAQRIVLISATPIPYMHRLGFEFIELEQEGTAPLNVVPVSCEKGFAKYLLANLTAQARKDPGKTQVVFWDSKDDLEAIARELVSAGKAKAEEIAVLHSDNKEDNPVYEAIIKKREIPKGVKYVFTTRLIADGVSIKNDDIGAIHQVDVKNEELFIQFSARFRSMVTKTVYSYRHEGKASQVWATEEALKASYKFAEQERERIAIYGINTHGRGFDARNREDTKSMTTCYFSELTGAWKVSDLYIFHEEIARRDRQTTPTKFYQRIEAKYDYVSILEPMTPEEADIELLEANVKADKRMTKQLKGQAYRKLLSMPYTFLRAVHDTTKARQTREEIAGIIDTSAEHPQACELVEENRELFERKAWKEPVKQFCRLIQIGFTQAAAVQALTDRKNRSRKGFSHLESRAQVQLAFSDPGTLDNGKDIHREKQLRKVRERLEHHQGEELTPKQLRDLVEIDLLKVKQNQAPRIAREMFEMAAKMVGDKDNRYRVYVIGDSLTLDGFARQYGMDTDDFLQRARKGAEKAKIQVPDNQKVDKNKHIIGKSLGFVHQEVEPLPVQLEMDEVPF